jgi:F0F1-type ATP synthase membrane subunit b/b'
MYLPVTSCIYIHLLKLVHHKLYCPIDIDKETFMKDKPNSTRATTTGAYSSTSATGSTADKGDDTVEKAKIKANEVTNEAQRQASDLADQAKTQAGELAEEAKKQLTAQSEKVKTQAFDAAESQKQQTTERLHGVAGALRQSGREFDNQEEETVDAIQEQFQPEQLKAQARTVIEDTLSDGADTIVDYVRTNRHELTVSLTDTIRRNPLPVLLIGAGIGWLMIDSFSSDLSSRDRDEYSMQRYADDYDYRIRRVPRGYGRVGYAEERWDYEGGSSSGGIQDAVETIKDKADNVVESVSSAAARAGDAVQGTAADVKNRVQGVGDDAATTADRWSSQAGRQVDDYQRRASVRVDRYGNAIQQQADQIGDQAQYYARRAQDQAAEFGDQAQYYAQRAQDEAGHYAQRAQHKTSQTINDNPLLFGAVAMGVGALMALMLPETRQENELMGEVSDKMMRTAHGAVGDMAQRAQNVVEEVRPEVEQAVQKVADEAQKAGKSSLKHLKSTGTEAVQRVQDKAQASVETEVSKAKSDLEQRAKESKSKVEKSVKPDSALSAGSSSSTGRTSKS